MSDSAISSTPTRATAQGGPAGSLSLNAAQQHAWLMSDATPSTALQALGQLEAMAAAARQSSEAGHDLAALKHLEDSLLHCLIALKVSGAQAETALQRALNRTQQHIQTCHIYPDLVELRHHGELRHSWPLHSEEDYRAALRLARELDCEIIHSDSEQLALFR